MPTFAPDGGTDADGIEYTPPPTARYIMFRVGDDGLTEPERRIAELEAALKPFADAVRADNHDVTIDASRIEHGHYMRAKRLLKI